MSRIAAALCALCIATPAQAQYMTIDPSIRPPFPPGRVLAVCGEPETETMKRCDQPVRRTFNCVQNPDGTFSCSEARR